MNSLKPGKLYRLDLDDASREERMTLWQTWDHKDTKRFNTTMGELDQETPVVFLGRQDYISDYSGRVFSYAKVLLPDGFIAYVCLSTDDCEYKLVSWECSE